VYGELQGWDHDRAKRKEGHIYDTLLQVFAIAKRDGIPSYVAADRMAEQRIAAVAGLRRL
jgi:leucine dehydrogenase